MNLNLILGIMILMLVVPVSATYTSQYPPAYSDTYVKSTTIYDEVFSPYYATDPSKSLIGEAYEAGWVSSGNTNQRFHIDLGSAKTIKRIYYENMHMVGGETDIGVNNFTIWGSDAAGSFATLTYTNDTGWTQITASQLSMDIHVAANTADPKYITLTNNNAYRYYAIKAANNHGDGEAVGFRRIELQTEDGEAPIAAFSGIPLAGLTPLEVTLTDASTGDPDSWTWSFGDGTVNSTDQNPVHIYGTGGAYTVGLTASNIAGESSETKVGYISVYNRTSSATITPNPASGLVGTPIELTPSGINATKYNWFFPNGTSILNTTSAAINIVFGTGGTYSVKLNITDAGWGGTEINGTINIYNQTIASFTQTNQTPIIPPNATIVFYPLGSTNATSWNWHLWNGTWFNRTTAATANLSIIFSAVGNYTVNLTTTDNGYGQNTQLGFVNVTLGAVTPGASFTLNRVLVRVPQLMIANDTSSNAPTGWQWSFGDGSANITDQNATHQYSRTGLFTIGLTASNVAGESSTSQVIWSFSRPMQFSPFTRASYSCEDMTYSTSRELTPQERIMTDEKMIHVCTL